MIQKNTEKYGLLDSIRGACIISMVLYHGMYDIVNILGVPASWFNGPLGYAWQQSICTVFILLSGFCWSFSKRPLKRALILLICGAVITLVTYFVMPSQFIQYGILTCLGLCALITIPLSKLIKRIPPSLGAGISLLLFLLAKDIPKGYFGFYGVKLFDIPASFYSLPFFAVLGFPDVNFYSGDYFPLIPWFFLFTLGYFLHKLVFSKETVPDILYLKLSPLSFLGRHSLIIYIIHQPLLMAVSMVLQAVL